MAGQTDVIPSLPTLRGSVRSLPGPAWVLFGGSLVNHMGIFVLPFVTLYLTKQGYSPTEAGVAVGIYGLGELAAQLPGGLLADRIGRRNTIALSNIAAGLLVLVLWRARSLTLIYPLMGMRLRTNPVRNSKPAPAPVPTL